MRKITVGAKEYPVTEIEDVLEAVDANHIWLNAFACVNPSDELALAVGRQVLEMVNQRENLLPKFLGTETLAEVEQWEDGPGKDAMIGLAPLTPILYLSVNKS